MIQRGECRTGCLDTVRAREEVSFEPASDSPAAEPVMSSKKKKRKGGAGKGASGGLTNRNAPCPCGSGRAFKNCCAGLPQEGPAPGKPSRRGSYLAAALVFCLLAGGVLLAVFRPWDSPGETPNPWEYDEANDRYWHPIHEHWHDGPPPEPAAQRPAAWEYDEANDRYWHPLHQHWHSGRPPPEWER